jgi:hypothetical protein
MDLDETQKLPRPKKEVEERLHQLKAELDATYALLEKQLDAKTEAQRARIELYLERWRS